jgi:hypothetical protein
MKPISVEQVQRWHAGRANGLTLYYVIGPDGMVYRVREDSNDCHATALAIGGHVQAFTIHATPECNWSNWCP